MARRPTRAVKKTPGPDCSKTWPRSTSRSPPERRPWIRRVISGAHSREVTEEAGGLRGEAAGRLLRPVCLPAEPPASSVTSPFGAAAWIRGVKATELPRARGRGAAVHRRARRLDQGEVQPFAAVRACALAGEGSLLDAEHPQRVEGAVVFRQQQVGRCSVPHFPPLISPPGTDWPGLGSERSANGYDRAARVRGARGSAHLAGERDRQVSGGAGVLDRVAFNSALSGWPVVEPNQPATRLSSTLRAAAPAPGAHGA